MTHKRSSAVQPMRREEVEARAEEVRRLHGLTSIPVDPVVLANKLGIKVQNAKFSEPGISGMIAKRGDNVTILVDMDEPPYRKRFTIAHELAHHFLHMLQDGGEHVDSKLDLFRTSEEGLEEITDDIRMQIQANQFAAALLMPAGSVREGYKDHLSLGELARRFNVSEEAMAFRLQTLGLA